MNRFASLLVVLGAVLLSSPTWRTAAASPPPPGEGLEPLAATRDLGPPTDVSDELRAQLGRVLTDPGRLPQLEVDVEGKKMALPLKHTHVSAELSGFVARVVVTQRYRNPMSKPIEAVYVFPLPENSAVDDMKIRIGERLIEAEIQKREDARRTYEAARREGYTAALLEQERPNIFTQSIANMEPGEDIEVIIRYVQDLTYDAGEYEFVFPMVVGPRFIPGTPTGGADGTGWSPDTDAVPDASRITPPILGGGQRSGHDISLDVTIAPGLGVRDFDVPTHAVTANGVDGAMVIELARADEIPNRDFVLRFRADNPLPQGVVYAHKGKRGGFFSLVVQPPSLDVDALLGRREIIFVVDVSGSMSGRPLAMAKDAAREAIRKLRPVDTFNVLTFSGRTAKAFPTARPANTSNIRTALSFVDGARAGGGTHLARAVEDALSPEVRDGRNRTVVFLTDGYVGNEAGIHEMVRGFVKSHEEKGHTARAFGFGIGSSTNRHLLDGIGTAGKGAAVYLTTREMPGRAVKTVFRMIDHPILTDVTVDWGGLTVEDVMPDELPDLLASRPLVLHGRYKKGGTATVTVSGELDGRRQTIEIPVTLPAAEERNGVLETLWARSRIESLQRQLWDGPNTTVVETITALGLDYRLVTAYTSFVAVDRSKKVGDGDPERVVQPVHAPEGVDPTMAAPSSAMRMRPARRTGGRMDHFSGGGATRAPAASPPPAPMERVEDEPDEPSPAVTATPATPAAPRGQVVVASPSTDDTSYDVRAAHRVLRRRAAAMKRCYEKRLKTNPHLAGRLTLRWTIGADGRVTKVEVVSDTAGDADFARCLVSQLKRIRFEPPTDGEVVLQINLLFRT